MSCCEAAVIAARSADGLRRPATTGTPWGFCDARNLVPAIGRGMHGVLFTMIASTDAAAASAPAATTAGDRTCRARGRAGRSPARSSCILAASSTNVRIAWRLVGDSRARGCRPGRDLCGSLCHRQHTARAGGARSSGQAARSIPRSLSGSGIRLSRRQRPDDRPATRARPISPPSAPTIRPTCCAQLLDHLAIAPLQAIVGASYGGMVALAFAERFPTPGRPHRRHQRRRSLASHGDRMAQRAARDGSLCADEE